MPPSNEIFKLPYSPYEIIVELVKAFETIKGPISLERMSENSSISLSYATLNFDFLKQVEIIDSQDTLTDKGISLAIALNNKSPDKISLAWRRIVDTSNFLTNLVKSIRIRNGMDETTLRSHIIHSASSDRNKVTRAGAHTVIKILEEANCIKEVDGTYLTIEDDPLIWNAVTFENHTSKTIQELFNQLEKLNTPSTNLNKWTRSTKAYEEWRKSLESRDKPEPKITHPSTTVTTEVIEDANVQIRIDVKVECKFSELDQLGPKLQSLIKDLKSSENNK